MPSDQDQTRQAYRPANPSRQIPSSRIPPSDMGPYEGAQKRGPSLTNRLVVLGGAGVVAAAVTAGGILAARRLINAIDGDDDPKNAGKRDHLAPRFAQMGDDEREALRVRARERARRDRNELARLRAQAARERAAPRRNLAHDLTDSATRLSGSLNGVVTSLTGALSGFRMVAAQASGIVREFSDAADIVRGVLNAKGEPSAERRDFAANRDAADQADQYGRDEPLRAEPRDRTHRL